MVDVTCFDESCKYFKKIIHCERSFFYGHVLKKPRSKLETIAEKYHILPNPRSESKYALTNSIVDFAQAFVSEQ